MRILVTGAAGFIGFHLSKALIDSGYDVLGIDNLNDYYDVNLKTKRLDDLDLHVKSSSPKGSFAFQVHDISCRSSTEDLFKNNQFDCLVNLAAQAGVRYSIENPHSYINSNIVGFTNILEGARNSNLNHVIFASSSSVYGMNAKQPFSTFDNTDYPISLYAASKKSNELLAHSYSHLYGIPITGLRFFTVYGPYGRPDMAYYKFTKAILDGSSIDIYNHGKMKRDFTYIDDIVEGILRLINKIPVPLSDKVTNSQAPFKIYNIGNNNPVTLHRFISAIEDSCKKKANKNLLPMQPGDVPITYADIDDLKNEIDFQPSTSIEEGISNFVNWYKRFKGIN
ncbi:NAD-dependent epimerase [Gammaproteobacteria bacterium]|nr:NAD-dependent epimerase [Gammaproteobacteria bacterium]